MTAMMIKIRTWYECFLKKDQIWLQCWNSSKTHVTMISGRISWKWIYDDCNHIWSFFKKHSYHVLILIIIAIIFGPIHKNYCNHKWSNPITGWIVHKPWNGFLAVKKGTNKWIQQKWLRTITMHGNCSYCPWEATDINISPNYRIQPWNLPKNTHFDLSEFHFIDNRFSDRFADPFPLKR